MDPALVPKAIGEWSLGPPPYLEGIDERTFKHMAAEWLGRIMRKGLLPSHRLVSYFLADQLNWATMDCWPSQRFIAGQSKLGEKTIQRAINVLENALGLSVFRARGSRKGLRYAPVYSRGSYQDTAGAKSGRPCPSGPDIQDHESFLESVRKHQAGLQSFRSMRRIEASRRNASALRLRFSQSFASLRQRLS